MRNHDGLINRPQKPVSFSYMRDMPHCLLYLDRSQGTRTPTSLKAHVLMFLRSSLPHCRNEPHNTRQSTYKRQQKQMHLPRRRRHRIHKIPRAKIILHPLHTPLPPTPEFLSLTVRLHARYQNNFLKRTTNPTTHTAISHIGTSGHEECTDSTKSRSEART